MTQQHEHSLSSIAELGEADFIRLLDENKARIMRICKAYTATSEDREDLFQDIAVHIWKALPSYRAEARLSTWLYRIALNVALRYSDAHKRRAFSKRRISWIEEQSYNSALSDEERERAEYLHAYIQKLPSAERSLTALYLEGFTYKEISEITELTETNVGVKINRIKNKLLVSMQQDSISSPSRSSSTKGDR